MRIPRHATAIVLAALAFSACLPKQEAPLPSPGTADFSRVVVIGGSELSGYQDGALSREGQRNGVGALLAQQLQQAGGGEFPQALMPEGQSMGLNKPWESRFLQSSRLGDRTDCNGEVSLGPVRDTVSEASLDASGVWASPSSGAHDLAIPFMTLAQLSQRGLGSDRSLDGPAAFAARHAYPAAGQSTLDAAIALQPSFLVMWPGMADVWEWARQGGAVGSLPDPASFRQRLDSILSAIDAPGGVLATIPDIGHLPYFTTIPARALTLTQSKADSLNDIYNLVGANIGFQEGENGFVVGDPGNNPPYRQLNAGEYITLSVPLDSMKCYFMGVLFTLMPNRYTLIASEIDLLRTHTDAYNAAIRDLADAHGYALADLATFYASLDAGIRFDAVDFSTEFVSGGYFSLDGFHPHPKGAGTLTNELIAAINAKYGATVPPLELHTLRGVLFP